MADTVSESNNENLPETLIPDPIQRAEKEAENGIKQFKFARVVIGSAIEKHDFRFRVSLLLELNRFAIDGIMRSAGSYRRKHVQVVKNNRVVVHDPPQWPTVPGHVDDMLDYINYNGSADPIHLSAYALWRLNWIHPFVEGNGRTARMFSYIVLCARLGMNLPGTLTIPEQIANSKKSAGGDASYYLGLRSADAAWDNNTINVEDLERMIRDMLKIQIQSRSE